MEVVGGLSLCSYAVYGQERATEPRTARYLSPCGVRCPTPIARGVELLPPAVAAFADGGDGGVARPASMFGCGGKLVGSGIACPARVRVPTYGTHVHMYLLFAACG